MKYGYFDNFDHNDSPFMSNKLENKPRLGLGIYTIPDISKILDIPYYKASRWIKEYWDNRLGKSFSSRYSWTDGKANAVSFHTLIELFVFFQFSKAGVKTTDLLNAHELLSKRFKTPYPFATSSIIDHLFTDGRQIYFQHKDEIIVNLDTSNQLNFNFIKLFFKKIEFNEDSLASRLWPLGKDKSVVIDPNHQFGQPVISGTNILPYTLNNMRQAGETIEFIASIYDLKVKQVKDAIEYCKKAA